ncbi:unnamed protein product [Sphacelaria rigidula]
MAMQSNTTQIQGSGGMWVWRSSLVRRKHFGYEVFRIGWADMEGTSCY